MKHYHADYPSNIYPLLSSIHLSLIPSLPSPSGTNTHVPLLSSLTFRLFASISISCVLSIIFLGLIACNNANGLLFHNGSCRVAWMVAKKKRERMK